MTKKKSNKIRKPKEVSLEQIRIQDGKYNYLDVCRYLKTTSITAIGDYLGLECRSKTENGKQASVDKIAKTYYITKEQFDDIASQLEKYKNYYSIKEIMEKYNLTDKTIKKYFFDCIEIDPIKQIRVISIENVKKYIEPFSKIKEQQNATKKKFANNSIFPTWDDMIPFLNNEGMVCLNDVVLRLNTGRVKAISDYFNIKYEKNRYSAEFAKKYLTKEEFEIFKNDYCSSLEKISLYDACKLLNINEYSIESRFEDKIRIDNFSKTKMILQDDFQNIIKPYFEKKLEFGIFMKIEEFNISNKPLYITEDDVVPIKKIQKEYFKNTNVQTITSYLSCSQFYFFIDIEKSKNVTYVLKNDIDNIVKYLNDFLYGYSFKSLLKTLGIIHTQPLSNETREKILNQTFNWIKPGDQYVISKYEIDEYVDNLKKNKDVSFILVGKPIKEMMKFVIYKSPLCNKLLKNYGVENYTQINKKVPLDISGGIIINDRDFLNLENAIIEDIEYVNILSDYVTSKLENVSTSMFRRFYKSFRMIKANCYVSKEELDSVIEMKNNCISLYDLWEFCANKIDLTLEDKSTSQSYYSIEKLFENGVVDFFQKAGYRKEKVYFFQTNDKEKELEDIAEIIIDNRIKGLRTIYEPYRKYKLDRLKVKYYESKEKLYSYIIDFYTTEITNEYLETHVDSAIINCFAQVMELFDDNILTLNTNDVIKLVTQFNTFSSRFICKDFLYFLHNKYETSFDKFTLRMPNELSIDDKEKIYSKEEWENLIVYLANIDEHIEKAFDDINYSRGWFFYLMGIAMPWRHSDILNLPKMQIDTSQYNIEWFKNNDFSISDAQYVISDYKNYAERCLIEKTQEQKHFIVPNAIIIPFSISLIILNNWTKNKDSKENNLFSKKTFDFSVKELFQNPLVQNFTMLKANRSFITYGNEYAAHSVKFSYGGYALLGQARGHKMNEMGYSETTAIYVNSIDTDGDINEICLGMFNRGVFGWLYYSLLEMTTNVDKLKFCDINHIIDSIKKELSVIGLENISGWINNEALSRQAILKSISEMPTDDIKELLNKLNKSCSKTDNILCSMINISSNCSANVCVNPLIKDCTFCKYSIPTTYSLMSIGNELIDLLNKANKLPDEDMLHKHIYANHILKLLSIVGQAKLVFDDIDKNYISSLIKLDELKLLIKQNKLLNGE